MFGTAAIFHLLDIFHLWLVESIDTELKDTFN